MRTVFLCGVAALALAGCASNMPDSGAGVGFQDYGEQQYRSQQEAQNTQLTSL